MGSGKYLQDLGVDVPNLATGDISDWTVYGGNTISEAGGIIECSIVDNTQGMQSSPNMPTSTIGKLAIISFSAKVSGVASGEPKTWFGTALTYLPRFLSTEYQDFVLTFSVTNNTDKLGTYFINLTIGETLYLKDYNVREATAYEINNYEEAVRADNGTVGATNLLLMSDASGRTIATTPPKTVTFPITPDTPFTIPTDYTIDEVVQLDNGDYHHYIYTSEGKLYTDGLLTGSFTKPSGDWVLDDKTFDKAHTIKLRGATIFRNYAFDKVSQYRSAYLEAKIVYPLIP